MVRNNWLFTLVAMLAWGLGPGGIGSAAQSPLPFGPRLLRPGQGHLGGIVLADFDRDGRLDIAASGRAALDNQATTWVWTVLPDGSPGEPRAYQPGRLDALRAADVTGDGARDLVGLAEGAVRVLAGLPDGTFGDAFEAFHLDTLDHERLALGDVDGDGQVDVAVVSWVPAGQGLRHGFLLRNLGGGQLGELTWYSQDFADVEDVALDDVDGDGRADLVLAGQASGGGGLLQVRRSLGAGAFAAPWTLPFDRRARRLCVDDLDADGRLDIAVIVAAPIQPARVEVLAGLGDGSFDPQTALALPYWTETELVAGDVDGDGRLDLVTGALTIFTSLGGLRFAADSVFVGSTLPLLHLGDVTGDGRLDAIGSRAGSGDGHGIVIVPGSGDFGFARVLPTTTFARRVALADVDGDGRLDAVGRTADGVAVSAGQGNGSFGAARDLQVDSIASVATPVLAAADVSGDGRADIVIDRSAAGSPQIAALFSDPSGGLADPVSLQPGDATSLVLGDVDGDGARDVVATIAGSGGSPAAGRLVVIGNAGGGAFLPARELPVTGELAGVDAADIDGDGAADLVASERVSGTLVRLIGLGDGSFVVLPAVVAGDLPEQVVAGDLDHDGDVDAAVLRADGSVGLLTNDGAGLLELAGELPLGAMRLLLGDVELDGRLDLLAVHAAGSVSVTSAGDALVLAPAVQVAVEQYVGDVALGDADEDGFPDLLVANGTTTCWLHPSLARGWADVGHVLPLVVPGPTPRLAARGQAVPGAPVRIAVTGAPSGAAGLLIVGTAVAYQAFGGGVLVPAPEAALSLPPSGALVGHWPGGLPTGTTVALQAWFSVDGTLAATNGLLTVVR